MLNRKIDKYLQEYYKNNRQALLVTGARQTGKTYSIREFGKAFKSFVEINFIENPEAAKAFPLKTRKQQKHSMMSGTLPISCSGYQP